MEPHEELVNCVRCGDRPIVAGLGWNYRIPESPDLCSLFCRKCGNCTKPVPIGPPWGYDGQLPVAVMEAWNTLNAVERKADVKPKLYLDLNGLREPGLEVSRVTEVDLTSPDKQFIYFERRPDGTWQMTYTKTTIPDITEFTGVTLRRNT